MRLLVGSGMFGFAFATSVVERVTDNPLAGAVWGAVAVASLFLAASSKDTTK